MIVNIGGIANATVLHRKDRLSGFDTGPGTTLMDHWFRQHQPGAYDENGTWARSGKYLPKLLSALLEHDYFSRPLPKSTGLEEFNLDWLSTYLIGNERPEDVQATLVELTVESISQSIKNNVPATDAVYLCGGGANNEYLINQLDNRLTPLPLYASDRLGLPETGSRRSLLRGLQKNVSRIKPQIVLKSQALLENWPWVPSTWGKSAP